MTDVNIPTKLDLLGATVGLLNIVETYDVDETTFKKLTGDDVSFIRCSEKYLPEVSGHQFPELSGGKPFPDERVKRLCRLSLGPML